MYIVLLQLDSSSKYICMCICIFMRYVVDFNNRSNLHLNLFSLLGHYYKSASIKSRIKSHQSPSKKNNKKLNGINTFNVASLLI